MILLNLIWPGLYIFEEIWHFWFLIFATIIIEAYVVKTKLKLSFQKSLLVSTIGNLISGIIGTFLFMLLMLVWHFVFDSFLPDSIKWTIDIIASIIIMCMGSILIETMAISFFFKISFRKLFVPLMIGNILTYLFIIGMHVFETQRIPEKTTTKEVLYYPIKSNFKLYDSSELKIINANCTLEYDKNNKLLDSTYNKLIVKFTNETKGERCFDLTIYKCDHTNAIGDSTKEIYIDNLSDTLFVLIEQRDEKWKEKKRRLSITDTIIFVKQFK